MSRVASLLIFSLFWQEHCVLGSVSCDSVDKSCAACFNLLVSNTITPERNQYNLQKAFFPADTANPVYVTVHYVFMDGSNLVGEKLWFWSESSYYATFHPLEIYQYTSLFFGDFDIRKTDLILMVQVDNVTVNCDKASDGFMTLLTQRLKLFAETPSVTPTIDDNYKPKAVSVGTVQQYHAENRHISRLLLSVQIIFPIIVMLWSIILLVYFLYYKSYANHFREAEKMSEAEAKSSIIFTLSFTFSLYAFIMSIVALVQEPRLSDDIKLWYNQVLFSTIVIVFIEDLFIFGFLLAYALTFAIFTRYWWYFCACSIIAPLTNLSVHANHIVLAFIHNQEHAVSVGIFYGIVVIVNVHVMRVVSSFCTMHRYLPYINLCLALVINLLFAYLAAIIYIMLPTNNIFGEAPDQIRLIYNTLIVSFTAVFTYWFLVDNNDDTALNTGNSSSSKRQLKRILDILRPLILLEVQPPPQPPPSSSSSSEAPPPEQEHGF